jgi:hypothetical protein
MCALACPTQGTTSSFVSAAQGQVYYWGKARGLHSGLDSGLEIKNSSACLAPSSQIKTSGDNAMYPRPLMDLSGWQPRGFSAGAATFAVCADSGAEARAFRSQRAPRVSR